MYQMYMCCMQSEGDITFGVFFTSQGMFINM